MKKSRLVLAVLCGLSLSGCLSTGGESAYTVKPIQKADGKIICCEVVVNNTKEYDKLNVKLKLKEDGTVDFELSETGVKTNAAVAAESNNKLLELVTGVIPLNKGEG